MFRIFISCLFSCSLNSSSSVWQYCCFFFQYQWLLLTPSHCARSHRYPAIPHWLHRAEQVSCVKCNSFHIYILVCLNRPPVSIALKERQPEITQGHTFFWELQCSNSAISRDFGWKLRHCLLSSECWLEKYLKLIVQSREWLSSFKKGVQGLSSPALDTPPTIFFCFLPHTHKHLLLHISSALSSSSCIRYLILWSSWNSWHKT